VREDLAKRGVRNMEAVELGLREAIGKDARRILEALYVDPNLTIPDGQGRPGEKRHPARPKTVQTLFGPITLRRTYFYREDIDQGRAPLDEALGLIDGYSPALVRLADRAAARMGYENASADLAALANVQVEGRQIQRLVNRTAAGVAKQRPALKGDKDGSSIPVLYIEVDGTGVPMMPKELEGRAGKQPDGSAKTREVKLGCVFTQTKTDQEGLPMRDYQSTTYVGSFASAEHFGGLIRAEALRRGLGRTQRVVFLGDGATWIWELARVNFPGAVQVLDLYHALERLHALCEGLYGEGTIWAERMNERWAQMFKQDKIGEVIAAARKRLRDLGKQPDPSLDTQIAYFENHAQRMLYLSFHNQGLFCGSGVVEAGCKTIVGQRLKHSGMFWSEAGATSILDLRCLLLSGLWDLCWNRLNDCAYLDSRAVA
jgi:hypothetical protein